MAGSAPETRDPHTLHPSRASIVHEFAVKQVTESTRAVADLCATCSSLPFIHTPPAPQSCIPLRDLKFVSGQTDPKSPNCSLTFASGDAGLLRTDVVRETLSELRAALRETPDCSAGLEESSATALGGASGGFLDYLLRWQSSNHLASNLINALARKVDIHCLVRHHRDFQVSGGKYQQVMEDELVRVKTWVPPARYATDVVPPAKPRPHRSARTR